MNVSQQDLSLDISLRHQDICSNILTLLYQMFIKFILTSEKLTINFRKIKDQEADMGVIIVLTLIVLITPQI